LVRGVQPSAEKKFLERRLASRWLKKSSNAHRLTGQALKKSFLVAGWPAKHGKKVFGVPAGRPAAEKKFLERRLLFQPAEKNAKRQWLASRRLKKSF
jgi:hypothetical protein